jgi:hypothetical protein
MFPALMRSERQTPLPVEGLNSNYRVFPEGIRWSGETMPAQLLPSGI